MIQIDYKNLFEIDSQHGISENELSSYKDRISDFLEKIEKRNQGFYKILNNPEEIRTFSHNIKDNYEHIVSVSYTHLTLPTIIRE